MIASEVGVITSDARAVDRDVESMNGGVRAMPSCRIGVCEAASRPRTAASELSAYAASAHFGLTCGECREPGWSFARFGRSTTVLDDGRTIQIAGEHEDA